MPHVSLISLPAPNICRVLSHLSQIFLIFISIAAHAENDELHICALDVAGLFYGALTLAQLCRPALAAAAATGEDTFDLPLPEVLDWPDTEERGVWNGNAQVIYRCLRLY